MTSRALITPRRVAGVEDDETTTGEGFREARKETWKR